jgi:hypothetical protein
MAQGGATGATGWLEVCGASAIDEPARRIGTGHGRGALAIGPDDIWIANQASRSVARLAPDTFDLTAMLKLRKFPVAIAAGNDFAWVLCSNGWLWRISPSGPQVEGVARLGARARSVAVTRDSVWVLREGGRLIRLDQSSGEILVEVRVPGTARKMVFGHGALWIIAKRGRKVLRVDAESGETLAELPAPQRAVSLDASEQGVWLGCHQPWPRRGNWLYAVNPTTEDLGEPIQLPGPPRAIGQGQRSLWLACSADSRRRCTIERLEPSNGTLETWRKTDWAVSDLAVVGDSLLLAMSLAVSVPEGGPGYVGDGMSAGGHGGGHGGGGHGGGGH